jgi:hypothetical protein
MPPFKSQVLAFSEKEVDELATRCWREAKTLGLALQAFNAKRVEAQETRDYTLKGDTGDISLSVKTIDDI